MWLLDRLQVQPLSLLVRLALPAEEPTQDEERTRDEGLEVRKHKRTEEGELFEVRKHREHGVEDHDEESTSTAMKTMRMKEMMRRMETLEKEIIQMHHQTETSLGQQKNQTTVLAQTPYFNSAKSWNNSEGRKSRRSMLVSPNPISLQESPRCKPLDNGTILYLTVSKTVVV